MRSLSRRLVALAALLLSSGFGHAQQTLAAPSPSAAAPAVSATVLLSEDTPLRVRIEKPLDTRHTRTGDPVLFTLVEDQTVNDAVAIPRGATLHGEVVEAHKANALAGRPELELKLDSLELGGRLYPLYSYHFRMDGISRGAPALTRAVLGAAIGAQAGNIAGSPGFGLTSTAARAARVGEGAAAGAAAGAAVALVTAPPPLVVPAEAQMDFYLAAPLAIQPADAEETARLRRKVTSDEPKLYIRGEHP